MMGDNKKEIDSGVQYEAGGQRKNAGKQRYDLIPVEMQDALAAVLTKGAEKYADRNWEQGIPFVEGIMASMYRHIAAFMRGEDYDQESGLLHMAHVLTNAGFIVTLQMRGRVDLDDRGYDHKGYSRMPLEFEYPKVANLGEDMHG